MKQDRQTSVFWLLGAKSPLARFYTKNKREVYLKMAKYLMWPQSQEESPLQEMGQLCSEEKQLLWER